jgi:hypothetical protein
MKAFQIGGFGIDFWGFLVPWPLLVLWAFLLLILITGTLPARRRLRGISRAENPLAYWLWTSFVACVVLVFTVGWYSPTLLVEAVMLLDPPKRTRTE